LGVKLLCNDICMAASCGFNLLESQFPSLMAGLPSSALGSPLSPNSSNPAVAAAAGAKADEAAAGQKVKALRYLGSLGCGGCYPNVEVALLAALDDCTEVVRFEAASVLADTSRGRCRYCDSGRCCSPAVRKKLIKVATDTRDNGCFVEPSARVRRMARVALCNCGCDPMDELLQPMPMEGPSTESVVPPKPDASVGANSRTTGQADGGQRRVATTPQKMPVRDAESDVEMADFEDEGLEGSQPLAPRRSTEAASSADLIANSKGSVTKPYDKTRKQLDIIVNPSNPSNKLSGVPFNPEVAKPSTPGIAQDRNLPRIRWERAAISIYRFESKDAAVSAMEFLRQKSLGETPEIPADPNLKYVTTREVGWTRPQDVKSPELAKILFELPVGQVSPVIEVGEILLVCRVLERQPPDPASNPSVPTSLEAMSTEESQEVPVSPQE
jgi:hypothetical protein